MTGHVARPVPAEALEAIRAALDAPEAFEWRSWSTGGGVGARGGREYTLRVRVLGGTEGTTASLVVEMPGAEGVWTTPAAQWPEEGGV